MRACFLLAFVSVLMFPLQAFTHGWQSLLKLTLPGSARAAACKTAHASQPGMSVTQFGGRPLAIADPANFIDDNECPTSPRQRSRAIEPRPIGVYRPLNEFSGWGFNPVEGPFGVRFGDGHFVKREEPPLDADIARRHRVEVEDFSQIRQFSFTIVDDSRSIRYPMEGVANGGGGNVIDRRLDQHPFIVREVREALLKDVVEAK